MRYLESRGGCRRRSMPPTSRRHPEPRRGRLHVDASSRPRPDVPLRLTQRRRLAARCRSRLREAGGSRDHRGIPQHVPDSTTPVRGFVAKVATPDPSWRSAGSHRVPRAPIDGGVRRSCPRFAPFSWLVRSRAGRWSSTAPPSSPPSASGPCCRPCVERIGLQTSLQVEVQAPGRLFTLRRRAHSRPRPRFHLGQGPVPTPDGRPGSRPDRPTNAIVQAYAQPEHPARHTTSRRIKANKSRRASACASHRGHWL